MRRTSTLLAPLRACPHATAGPSRLPAVRIPSGRWRAPTPVLARWTSSSSSSSSSSSPAGRPDGTGSPHSHPAFEALSSALSASQPCFGARGDEIELLTSPEQFKATLLAMIKRAKRRILISSLYIGAGQSELLDVLRTTLKNNPHLRAAFILDYHRGTRLTPAPDKPASTAHLLLPLIEEFGDRVEVWLYRSPKLRGVMERIVPERFDEGWGTWHGKWYGVDDEVILSGANLATSYFTNRQDRYIHFRSHPSLLSYLSSLTRLYTHYSYLLSPSPSPSVSRHHLVPLPCPPGSPSTPAALIWPVPSIHPRQFAQHALATLSAFQNSWRASNAARLRRVDVDTWFWPVIQAGVLGIKEEEAAMDKVWRAVRESHGADADAGVGAAPVEVDLTSGYFGLYKAYKRAVIDSPAPVRVIAASPRANGFYGSKGFSRLIPEGYTLLESRFHRDAAKAGRSWDADRGDGVRLKEWEREGWTYHAKGMWVSPRRVDSGSGSAPGPGPGSSSCSGSGTDQTNPNPFVTFVGSSNLSTRSLTLDTELSLMLMTASPSLRKALGNEVRTLDRYAKDVGENTWKSEERRVSWLAWLLVALGVEGML